MAHIHVRNLAEDSTYQLCLEMITGEKGLLHVISSPFVHTLPVPGEFEKERVVLWGPKELEAIRRLGPRERAQLLRIMVDARIACLIIAAEEISEEMRDLFEKSSIPLFRTSLRYIECMERLKLFLDSNFGARTTEHGVLVDVLEIGIMILGKSGIGKSECALDLVQRGHQLVADDVIEIYKESPTKLVGRCSELIRHHMEVRGLGIINIEELFGISAVRGMKTIDLVVELVEWRENEEYERLGLEYKKHTFLGIDVPMLTIPVSPGRNISTIVEVAARNQLLRQMGRHPAMALQERILKETTGGES